MAISDVTITRFYDVEGFALEEDNCTRKKTNKQANKQTNKQTKKQTVITKGM